MIISYTMMWMNVLSLIKLDDKASITGITRKMNASYTHVFNIIKALEAKNILTITKYGRDNRLALTVKGLKVIACLEELKSLMEDE